VSAAANETGAAPDEGPTPTAELSDGGAAWAGKYELLLSEHATRAGHSIAVAQLVRLKPWEALCVATVRTVLRCFWYLLYLVCPRLGHRLTAYIAEENAVITTHLINDVNLGKIDNSVAPPYIVAAYGGRVELSADGGSHGGRASSGARLRDAAVLLRADELGFCRRHHDWADALDKYKAATRSGSFRR
jgi:ubiquinol oxidase